MQESKQKKNQTMSAYSSTSIEASSFSSIEIIHNTSSSSEKINDDQSMSHVSDSSHNISDEGSVPDASTIAIPSSPANISNLEQMSSNDGFKLVFDNINNNISQAKTK